MATLNHAPHLKNSRHQHSRHPGTLTSSENNWQVNFYIRTHETSIAWMRSAILVDGSPPATSSTEEGSSCSLRPVLELFVRIGVY